MYILLAQVIPERLDWFNFGISSANRTGAFIACLIAFTWCLYAFRIKWLSILTWIANLVLFYFLVQTASRGALVSLTAASIFFLFFSGFKRSCRTVFFVLFWFACALLILLQSRLSHRMEKMVTLQSSSANCRLDIYLSGLKMLTDAPSGVQSPIETYMQWYQDPDDSERYLSMIISHFGCLYFFYYSRVRMLYCHRHVLQSGFASHYAPFSVMLQIIGYFGLSLLFHLSWERSITEHDLRITVFIL